MNIKNKTQFIEYFTSGIKPSSDLKIGVEQEKFLFDKKNKKRIDYSKLKKIFENLKKKIGRRYLKKIILLGLAKENKESQLNLVFNVNYPENLWKPFIRCAAKALII